MSNIYKNTFAGLTLGYIIDLGRGFINYINCSRNEPYVASFYLNPLINLVDMACNGFASKNESISCDKVFYSPSQVWLPNCNIIKQEMNYIDMGGKCLSIGIAGAYLIQGISFSKDSSNACFVLPAILTFIGETANDMFELGLVCEKTWIQDQSGQHTYYEL